MCVDWLRMVVCYPCQRTCVYPNCTFLRLWACGNRTYAMHMCVSDYVYCSSRYPHLGNFTHVVWLSRCMVLDLHEYTMYVLGLVPVLRAIRVARAADLPICRSVSPRSDAVYHVAATPRMRRMNPGWLQFTKYDVIDLQFRMICDWLPHRNITRLNPRP